MSPTDSRRRNALIIALSSVACVAVIGAVVWAARERPRTDPWEQHVGRSPLDFEPAAVRADPLLEGCSSLDPEQQPDLVLDDGLLDFGRVKQGVVETREVSFRNAGNATLCILKIDGGCSCLKAVLAEPRKRRYEPGETGSLRVMLDSSRREGVVEKSIAITTNELENPVRELRARCDIALAIVLAPSAIRFGRVAKGEPTQGATTLRSPKEDDAWTVTEVVGTRLSATGDRVPYTFELAEVDDPRFRRITLVVKHPGLMQDGDFRDKLVVTTTHPERPRFELQSYLVVVPRIQVTPSRVALGFVRSGATRPPMRVELVPGAAGVEFEITGVRIEPRDGQAPQAGGEGFEASFGMENGRGWVDVRYDGRTRKPGLLEAVVVVETNEARAAEVRIPVSATIRRAP